MDYNTVPFPIPQYQVAPPGGSHLAEMPIAPREKWQRDTEMSHEAVLEHIRGIVNASWCQEQYLTHLDYLRQRADTLAVLDNAHGYHQRRAERPTFVDEDHVETLIASMEALQIKLKYNRSRTKQAMKVSADLLKQHTELTATTRQQKLKRLRIERDTALQTRAQVLVQEAPPPAQPAPVELTEALQRELQAAKTENERLRALGAALEHVSRCATLERELAQACRDVMVLQANAPNDVGREISKRYCTYKVAPDIFKPVLEYLRF